jgi:hypothetical protein
MEQETGMALNEVARVIVEKAKTAEEMRGRLFDATHPTRGIPS